MNMAAELIDQQSDTYSSAPVGKNVHLGSTGEYTRGFALVIWTLVSSDLADVYPPSMLMDAEL